MSVLRWTFQDPAFPSVIYTLPWNPQTMSSPFPARSITALATTAIDGQVLLQEGMAEPANWSFSGIIKDAAHYEALRGWTYGHGRIYIFDHFGRQLTVVLKNFKPSPEKIRIGHYWRHTYEVEGLVLAVGAPTIGDDGPS